MTTVSVIIPTYKHRDFVLATLDSVFAQTFTDYEVIVVNDGSPDDTSAVLRPLVESGRIRYIEQANAGQAAARNRGLEEAQGEFIALLDDDDLWPPDKLEWQIEALQSQPGVVLVYGAKTNLNENVDKDHVRHEYPCGAVEEAFLVQNWITSPGQTLIRKTALDQAGHFDPKIWGVDDWDLYIRLASAGEFCYIPRSSLYYRLHADNASKDIWRMYQNACLLARKHQNFGKLELRHLSGKLHRNIVDNYSNQFVQVVLRERDLTPQAACRALWDALRVKPAAVLDRCFLAAVAALVFRGRGQYDLLKKLFHWAVVSQRHQERGTGDQESAAHIARDQR